MAFDFPSSPGIGQQYTVAGITYVWDGIAWNVTATLSGAPKTAQARNRLVNGAMLISQENGNNGGSISGYYPADQWVLNYVSSSTINTVRGNGSSYIPNYVQITATPLETAAAAGEYVTFYQPIEGINLVDFGLGGGSYQFVIAFWCNHGTAGTYWVAILNDTASHSWLGSYIISAADVGNWVRRVIVVPVGAINAGTWPVTNVRSMVLHFCVHCGSTYTGVAGFQTGVKFAGPGQALGLSVGGCHFANIGLYLDPDLTGLPPPYQIPDMHTELFQCHRYWRSWGGGDMFVSFGYASGGQVVYQNQPFDPPMRVVPTPAFISWSYSNASGVSLNGGYPDNMRLQITAAATGAGFGYGAVTASARM